MIRNMMWSLLFIATLSVFVYSMQTAQQAPPPPQMVTFQQGIVDATQNYLVGTSWQRVRIEFSWDKKTWSGALPYTADDVARSKRDKYWVRYLIGDFVIQLEEIEQ